MSPATFWVSFLGYVQPDLRPQGKIQDTVELESLGCLGPEEVSAEKAVWLHVLKLQPPWPGLESGLHWIIVRCV